jgi:uncharacterized membrane protein YedE/YeeE
MENFTPGSALLGGALIGLASVILWLANGRIAGVSGIVGGGIGAAAAEWPWRLAFVAGLVAAPLLYAAAGGALPTPRISAGPALLVVAGLLVGIGAQMGGGCTSGHGVCGIARRSPRSLVAVAVFMAVAFGTVFVLRHAIGA